MYAKLFESIYDGTLRGHASGLLVFTNLLAHADATGCVDIHPKAISEEVGLQIAQVRETLIMLESPDEESRSPDMEGRRIVRLDEHRPWGWFIVNHAKYRAIRSSDDRREQNRLAQQRWRERQAKIAADESRNQRKQNKPHKPPSAHTDTETDALSKPPVSLAKGSSTPPPPKVKAAKVKPAPKPPKEPKPPRVVEDPKPSVVAWEGYSAAYEARYGVKPVHNGKTRGQMSQFVTRIPHAEAPEVAAFYVRHENQLYRNAHHCVDLLLRNAEALRTQWVTGHTNSPAAASDATDRRSRIAARRAAQMTGGLVGSSDVVENGG